MIPLEEALARVDEAAGRRPVPSETVPVREAAKRFLASDQRSRVDLPPFDKAAMDGYAVLADDVREEYRLVGAVAAGEAGVDSLAPGTTVKVMTGAPVPRGTAKVVMVEQATERDGRVRFERPGAASNMCRQAEDVAAGQTVLTAGSRLGVLEIANLIGCGIAEVEVARRVTLAVISTGDELADRVTELSPGKIMNTNGPLLADLARESGLAVAGEQTVPDDKSRLVATVKHALAEADIVVLSGGVSAGDYDFVPEAITAAGLRTHFSLVAVKPGRPTTFATGDRGVLFGLPGNPVAVYLMFHLFVLRVAARMSGGSYQPREFRVRLANEFTRRSTSRTEYAPCRVSRDGLAETVPYHGSAHLAALIQADGFLRIPPGVKSLAAGAEATLVTFGPGGG